MLELVPTLQDLRDGDNVHWLAPLVQVEHRAVDLGVLDAVEIVRAEDLGDLDDRITVDEEGAKNRLLGLDGLRRQAVQ